MTKNNFRHDGRTRPTNDTYAKRWSEIFGEKQDKELAESFKQSKKNKKERLDNEKKKNKANEDNRKDDWIWT
tara:strand:+ start:158 stop:373 length:216 start_codon:yes stop_codon:yes gene_type:complete